jgi:hypothetical protein
VNSVLRMQQARHRGLGQGMLDLKRLYWNCRVVTPFTFRRNSCPDILLGCERPEGGGYGRA